MKDYYDILQVSPNAEQEVIEAAYRRLARKYHPDINRDPTAAARMRELNEAYEVLGDRRRRAEYDAELGQARARAGAGRQREGAPPPPPPPPRHAPPPPPPRTDQAKAPDRPAPEEPAARRHRLRSVWLGLAAVLLLALAGAGGTAAAILIARPHESRNPTLVAATTRPSAATATPQRTRVPTATVTASTSKPPTTSPTASPPDFEEYRDEVYGYSILYPVSATITRASEDVVLVQGTAFDGVLPTLRIHVLEQWPSGVSSVDDFVDQALSQSQQRLRNFSVASRSVETIADGTLELHVVEATYDDVGGGSLVFHAAYAVVAEGSSIYEFQVETHWADTEGFALALIPVVSFRVGASVDRATTSYEARILSLGSTPYGAVTTFSGYPRPNHAVTTSDGFGGSLAAMKGICVGSATGRCQQVFFFQNGEYLGTDTLSPSLGILDVQYAGVAKIAVTYVNYAPSDPGCCPSLAPVTITYSWDGTQLKASGVPPGH